MEYAEKLKHPKWQEKRLRVFERDNFQCLYCKSKEHTLHVHHIIYTKKEPHDEPIKNLQTVCEDCHKIIEFYKPAEVNKIIRMGTIMKRHIVFVDNAISIDEVGEYGSVNTIMMFFEEDIAKLKESLCNG